MRRTEPCASELSSETEAAAMVSSDIATSFYGASASECSCVLCVLHVPAHFALVWGYLW